MADCLKLIREATELSDREIAQVLRDLQEEVARRGQLTDPELIATVAAERAQTAKQVASNKEVQAKINALVRADRVEQAKTAPTTYKGLTSQIAGTSDSVKASTESRGRAIDSLIREGVLRDLETDRKGLVKTMKNKEVNRRMAHALWDEGGKPPANASTIDLDAYHLASVVDKYKEVLRNLANQAGAFIERLPGHVFAQVHDARRIYNAGFEAWRDAILPRLDQQRTFGGQDAGKVLRAIFEKIQNDRYNVFTGDTGGSLASRMGNKRFLIFKSAEDWLSYNRDFGTGSDNVLASVLGNFERRAKEVAILQDWGPNADGNFERIVSAAAKADTGPVKNRMNEAQVAKLKAQWSALNGFDRAPASPNFAAAMAGIRTWLSMARLGGAFISSFNDLTTAAATARYNGAGYLSTYGDLMRGAAKSNPVVARFMDSFSEGMLSDIASRLSAEDGLPGFMQRRANEFFRLNALSWWTDRMKAGFAWSMSMHIGDNLKFGWDSIPAELRTNLGRYGINAEDWKLFQAAGEDVHNGRRFLTPEMVGEGASLKLRAWFLNEAEYAVPTPGVRERAFALRGSRPGTLPGEAARFIWQFKMFMLSNLMRTIPRTVEMGVPGAVHLAVMSSIVGYASMSAKDILSGKNVRDPSDPRTVASALVTSGGMGVLGDLLASDFTAPGRSLAEVAGGPALGVLGDSARVYSQMKDAFQGKGSWDDPKAKAAGILVQNIPYSNLFYAKGAINYFATYHIQEMLNPGYLQRMERRLKEQTGQSYWLRPGDAIQTGGGFR